MTTSARRASQHNQNTSYDSQQEVTTTVLPPIVTTTYNSPLVYPMYSEPQRQTAARPYYQDNIQTTQPPHAASRIEYIPFERKKKRYETREIVEKVPVEKTIIQYQAVKKINYVPKEKVITDYYVIQHQTAYIPRNIEQKIVEYVPVERYSERVQYKPVQKQIVHYPKDFDVTTGSSFTVSKPPSAVVGSIFRNQQILNSGLVSNIHTKDQTPKQQGVPDVINTQKVENTQKYYDQNQEVSQNKQKIQQGDNQEQKKTPKRISTPKRSTEKQHKVEFDSRKQYMQQSNEVNPLLYNLNSGNLNLSNNPVSYPSLLNSTNPYPQFQTYESSLPRMSNHSGQAVSIQLGSSISGAPIFGNQFNPNPPQSSIYSHVQPVAMSTVNSVDYPNHLNLSGSPYKTQVLQQNYFVPNHPGNFDPFVNQSPQFALHQSTQMQPFSMGTNIPQYASPIYNNTQSKITTNPLQTAQFFSTQNRQQSNHIFHDKSAPLRQQDQEQEQEQQQYESDSEQKEQDQKEDSSKSPQRSQSDSDQDSDN